MRAARCSCATTMPLRARIACAGGIDWSVLSSPGRETDWATAVGAAAPIASNARTQSWAIKRFMMARLPCLPVIGGVRAHVGGGSHAIAHVEKASDRGNVPDVAVTEAGTAQPLAVAVFERPGL